MLRIWFVASANSWRNPPIIVLSFELAATVAVLCVVLAVQMAAP